MPSGWIPKCGYHTALVKVYLSAQRWAVVSSAHTQNVPPRVLQTLNSCLRATPGQPQGGSTQHGLTQKVGSKLQQACAAWLNPNLQYERLMEEAFPDGDGETTNRTSCGFFFADLASQRGFRVFSQSCEYDATHQRNHVLRKRPHVRRI